MEHWPKKNVIVNGRAVFIEMSIQFGEIYKKVNNIAIRNKSDIAEKHKINITYLILFLGIGESTGDILDKYLQKYKDIYEEFINIILHNFSFEYYSENKHDGHQSRLGHYYRHLYQMVTFIDRTEYLSQKEKYFYVKTLRAQISTYELVLFFINSLSDFGRPWSVGEPCLIMKYNLIKNIPSDFVFGIEPKTYYPMM